MENNNSTSNLTTPNSAQNLNIAVFTAGGSDTLGMFDALPTSGFNTIILWSMRVDTSGNILIYNFGPHAKGMATLAANGAYNPDQNADLEVYQQKVFALKRTKPSSIKRVELSFGIGVSDDPTFHNIKSIYHSQLSGPSPESKNLMANIRVLQQVLDLDAVSSDDEYVYDFNSSLWFAQQCGLLGMTFSICPVWQQDYWSKLVLAANQNQTLIDVVYLQAWASGGVTGWVLGGILPVAGQWIQNDMPSPDDACRQLKDWQGQQPLAGGWYYNASDIYVAKPYTLAEYAQAIRSALG